MSLKTLKAVNIVGILVLASLLSSQAFAPSPINSRKTTSITNPNWRDSIFQQTSFILVQNAKKDEKDDRPEIEDSRNFYEKETEASQKVFGNLLITQNFDSIVIGAGFVVIVFGFALNYFGYDYVVKDGRLTIDTIEARQFQDEVRKAAANAKKESRSASAPTSVINTIQLKDWFERKNMNEWIMLQ